MSDMDILNEMDQELLLENEAKIKEAEELAKNGLEDQEVKEEDYSYYNGDENHDQGDQDIDLGEENPRKKLTADDLSKDKDEKSFRDYYANFKKNKRKYGAMTLDEKRDFYNNLEKEELVARLVEFDGAIPGKDRYITKLKEENSRLERVVLAVQNEKLMLENQMRYSAPAPQVTKEEDDDHSEFINKYKDIADEDLLKDLLNEATKKNSGATEQEINNLKNEIERVKMIDNIDRSRNHFDQVVFTEVPDVRKVSASPEFSDFSALRYDELELNDYELNQMSTYNIPGHRTVQEILAKSTEVNKPEPVVILLKHFKNTLSALSGKSQKDPSENMLPRKGSQTRINPTGKRDIGAEMTNLISMYDSGQIDHNEYLKQQTKLEKELINQK